MALVWAAALAPVDGSLRPRLRRQRKCLWSSVCLSVCLVCLVNLWMCGVCLCVVNRRGIRRRLSLDRRRQAAAVVVPLAMTVAPLHVEVHHNDADRTPRSIRWDPRAMVQTAVDRCPRQAMARRPPVPVDRWALRHRCVRRMVARPVVVPVAVVRRPRRRLVTRPGASVPAVRVCPRNGFPPQRRTTTTTAVRAAIVQAPRPRRGATTHRPRPRGGFKTPLGSPYCSLYCCLAAGAGGGVVGSIDDACACEM